MDFRVVYLQAAERDLGDIYDYIAAHDSAVIAERVVTAITELCESLVELPERGNFPKELQALKMRVFRELHYKPYRIIYAVHGHDVVIYAVADGRRDMHRFLRRRLSR